MAIVRQRVTPTIGQLFYWRGIYQSGNNYYFTAIFVPVVGKTQIKVELEKPIVIPQMLPESILSNAQLLKAYNVFEWFSDGYVFVAKEQPLTVCDGRYVSWGKQPVCLWALVFQENHAGQRIVIEKVQLS